MDPKFKLLLGWLFTEHMENLGYHEETMLASIQMFAGVSEFEAKKILDESMNVYHSYLFKDC